MTLKDIFDAELDEGGGQGRRLSMDFLGLWIYEIKQIRKPLPPSTWLVAGTQ